MSARTGRTLAQGDVLWEPPADARERFELGRYLEWLRSERGLDFAGYEELWRWSVTDLEAFWDSVWDFYEVRSHAPYERVLGSREMPGAEWFPGATPELRRAHARARRGRRRGRGRRVLADARAVRAHVRRPQREQVARARAGLQRLGVGPRRPRRGLPSEHPRDARRVPRDREPRRDLGQRARRSSAPRSVIDRLRPDRAEGAPRGRRLPLRRQARRPARARSPRSAPACRRCEHVVHVPYVGGDDDALPDAVAWDRSSPRPSRSRSSRCRSTTRCTCCSPPGTTGLPKAIVHGHGGILLEHLKNHGFSWDLKPGDRLLWFTTTAWMMWNALVSALLLRASIVHVRRQPGVARPREPVAARRGDEADPLRRSAPPT